MNILEVSLYFGEVKETKHEIVQVESAHFVANYPPLENVKGAQWINGEPNNNLDPTYIYI